MVEWCVCILGGNKVVMMGCDVFIIVWVLDDFVEFYLDIVGFEGMIVVFVLVVILYIFEVFVVWKFGNVYFYVISVWEVLDMFVFCWEIIVGLFFNEVFLFVWWVG